MTDDAVSSLHEYNPDLDKGSFAFQLRNHVNSSGKPVESQKKMTDENKRNDLSYLTASGILNQLSASSREKILSLNKMLGSSNPGEAYHTDAHHQETQTIYMERLSGSRIKPTEEEIVRQLMTLQMHDAGSLKNGPINDAIFPLNEDLDSMAAFDLLCDSSGLNALYGFAGIQATKVSLPPFFPKFQNMEEAEGSFRETIDLLKNFGEHKEDLEEMLYDIFYPALTKTSSDPEKNYGIDERDWRTRYLAHKMALNANETVKKISEKAEMRKISFDKAVEMEVEGMKQIVDLDIFNSATRDFFSKKLLMMNEFGNFSGAYAHPRTSLESENNLFLRAVIGNPFYSKLLRKYGSGKKRNILQLNEFLRGKSFEPGEKIRVHPKLRPLMVPNDWDGKKPIDKWELRKRFSPKELDPILGYLAERDSEIIGMGFAEKYADILKSPIYLNRIEMRRQGHRHGDLDLEFESGVVKGKNVSWPKPMIYSNGAVWDGKKCAKPALEEMPMSLFFPAFLEDALSLGLQYGETLDSLGLNEKEKIIALVNLSKLETMVTGVFHRQENPSFNGNHYSVEKLEEYIGAGVLNDLGTLGGIDMMKGFNAVKEGHDLEEIAEKLSNIKNRKRGENRFWVDKKGRQTIWQKYVVVGEDGSLNGNFYEDKKEVFPTLARNGTALAQALGADKMDDLALARTFSICYENKGGKRYLESRYALDRFIEIETLRRQKKVSEDNEKIIPPSWNSMANESVISDYIPPKLEISPKVSERIYQPSYQTSVKNMEFKKILSGAKPFRLMKDAIDTRTLAPKYNPPIKTAEYESSTSSISAMSRSTYHDRLKIISSVHKGMGQNYAERMEELKNARERAPNRIYAKSL